MSTPWVFKGLVAGRNTRGVTSVMLKEGGNEITEAKATVEFTDTLELHWREVGPVGGKPGVLGLPLVKALEEAVRAWKEEVHCPAVAAVVEALDQQPQEVHP